MQQDIQRNLEEWFTKHDVRLQRLTQSIRKTRERECARPSWDGFASLIAALQDGQECPKAPAEPGGAASHVETVGNMLIGLLKAANRAPGPVVGGKSMPTKGLPNLGQHIGIAEAALPLAVYLAKVVDDQALDRARMARDEATAEKRQQVVSECIQHARSIWRPFVDDVRAMIVAETSDQVDLDESLRQVVEQLQAAVEEGESLLRPGSARLGT
jgi:hypothetical protein